MKRFLICIGLLAAMTFTVSAQTMPAKPHQAPLSPPAKTMAKFHGGAISITYSSPRVRGREGHIFTPHGLISHDVHYPVWRAGANAATTLVTETDLKIGNLDVPKGKYTLFVDIANPNRWVLIVSKNTGEWGLAYKAGDDLGRVPMRMSKPSHMIEDLEWTITRLGHGEGRLTLAWEYHIASVPIEVH
jgi:hypothetical protein